MKAKQLIQAFVIVAAVLAGLVMSQRPWWFNSEEAVKADAQMAETKGVEDRVRELARRTAYAESPAGRDEAARKQGMLLPGEKFVEPPKTGTAQPR